MSTAKSKNNDQSSTNKKASQGNKNTGTTKATMPSVPTARERAKDMDTKRRSDAESNEL